MVIIIVIVGGFTIRVSLPASLPIQEERSTDITPSEESNRAQDEFAYKLSGSVSQECQDSAEYVVSLGRTTFYGGRRAQVRSYMNDDYKEAIGQPMGFTFDPELEDEDLKDKTGIYIVNNTSSGVQPESCSTCPTSAEITFV